MFEAIILAGGFGTRLQPVLREFPKAMAPVNGRPFLEYQLAYLKFHGIGRVVISAGYRSETIINHFGFRYNGIEIDYTVEKTPLGTGGGIRLAMEKCLRTTVLTLNGDTLFLIDLNDFELKHLQKETPVSIALRKVDDISRYGSVSLDKNNVVTAFGEKSAEKMPGLINGGIYLLDRNFYLLHSKPGNFSLEKDFFEIWYPKSAISGFAFDAYFRDIGIPEDYQKAHDEFKNLTF